jgi:hypothetical protein
MVLPGLCLSLLLTQGSAPPAGAPRPAAFVAGELFTLAWTHSIEKTRWEEDYRVTTTPSGLALEAVQSRIKGSAAGMEPPPDARLVDDWYAYTPNVRVLTELRLSRSEFAADHELCTGGVCRPLATWLGPAQGGTALVRPCTNIRPSRPASGSSG